MLYNYTTILLLLLLLYSPVVYFLQYICTKSYKSSLAVDKVIAIITQLSFFCTNLYINHYNAATKITTEITWAHLVVCAQSPTTVTNEHSFYYGNVSVVNKEVYNKKPTTNT